MVSAKPGRPVGRDGEVTFLESGPRIDRVGFFSRPLHLRTEQALSLQLPQEQVWNVRAGVGQSRPARRNLHEKNIHRQFEDTTSHRTDTDALFVMDSDGFPFRTLYCTLQISVSPCGCSLHSATRRASFGPCMGNLYSTAALPAQSSRTHITLCMSVALTAVQFAEFETILHFTIRLNCLRPTLSGKS